MSLCKIFGLLKKEDLIGKNIKCIMPKLFSDHHDEFLNATL
jgi:hypothetical protein